MLEYPDVEAEDRFCDCRAEEVRTKLALLGMGDILRSCRLLLLVLEAGFLGVVDKPSATSSSLLPFPMPTFGGVFGTG